MIRVYSLKIEASNRLLTRHKVFGGAIIAGVRFGFSVANRARPVIAYATRASARIEKGDVWAKRLANGPSPPQPSLFFGWVGLFCLFA
jgi:hypothetical protein